MKTIKRRRKEGKTDYLKRIKLIKGGKPRIVFRKTNKYIISQFVKSEEAQDKILIGITSKKLLAYGWPKNSAGGLKSIPAAYLSGYLMGRKIRKLKLDNPLVDFGMIKVSHKTKLFGFLKGLIDAGIKIECKKENFPSDERLHGKHLKVKIPFEEIKSKIDKE
jgi:large subunit ribosomal protein L18